MGLKFEKCRPDYRGAPPRYTVTRDGVFVGTLYKEPDYQKHPWRVEDFFGRIKIVDGADCFATLKVAMSAARKVFK